MGDGQRKRRNQSVGSERELSAREGMFSRGCRMKSQDPQALSLICHGSIRAWHPELWFPCSFSFGIPPFLAHGIAIFLLSSLHFCFISSY